MPTMVIKEQIDGVLQPAPADPIRGMTVRECYRIWDGKKIVAELVQSEGGGFICGTEKARDYYRKKGHKALTFSEALVIQRAASYMDEVIVPEFFNIPGNVLVWEWGQDIKKQEVA